MLASTCLLLEQGCIQPDVPNRHMHFGLIKAYCHKCVFCDVGIQEGCQWASVVRLAHQKHFQQPGGAECECPITSACGQCQPRQDHVWPGQQPHTTLLHLCLHLHFVVNLSIPTICVAS